MAIRGKKKYALLSALLAIAAGAGVVFTFWLQSYSAPQLFGEAISRVETEQKVIALTFDDGPYPPYTRQILEILSRHDARATFFVIGLNVKAHPNLFKSIIRSGHEIGNHSWDHTRLVLKNPAFIERQIAATDSIIRANDYQGEIYFRAPYGNKLIILPYILDRQRRKHILYNIMLYDWEQPAPEEMLAEFEEKRVNGSIVILHDGGGNRSNTVEFLKLLIDEYTARGYEFVTISELLAYR